MDFMLTQKRKKGETPRMITRNLNIRYPGKIYFLRVYIYVEFLEDYTRLLHVNFTHKLKQREVIHVYVFVNLKV